jgi:hypothetical protein
MKNMLKSIRKKMLHKDECIEVNQWHNFESGGKRDVKSSLSYPALSPSIKPSLCLVPRLK